LGANTKRIVYHTQISKQLFFEIVEKQVFQQSPPKFVDIFWQSMYNSARIVPAGYAGAISCIPIPQLPRTVAGAEPEEIPVGF